MKCLRATLTDGEDAVKLQLRKQVEGGCWTVSDRRHIHKVQGSAPNSPLLQGRYFDS